ncbi:hypothetical protein QQF64_018901 [Cirrhinus molitorella]|uniref:Uncharacterized protein n=1 Tax=Cirrhinus molitorella TaxID=172907 RepID=A0ABR3LDZ9_9TELE
MARGFVDGATNLAISPGNVKHYCLALRLRLYSAVASRGAASIKSAVGKGIPAGLLSHSSDWGNWGSNVPVSGSQCLV